MKSLVGLIRFLDMSNFLRLFYAESEFIVFCTYIYILLCIPAFFRTSKILLDLN